MKILSVIFYVFGGVLIMSALDVISENPAKGFAFKAGTFLPTVFFIAVGWFLSKKVKPKETI